MDSKEHSAFRHALIERFAASRKIGFEAWHDGLGYEIALIHEASTEERAAIETLLLASPVADWRDVEALATLATPRAQKALREVLAGTNNTLKIAVHRYAPELAQESERAATLVFLLETATFFHGLSQALDQVEVFHPPAVIEALWRGVQGREGEVAVHFAAMLLFLHGQAETAFDIQQRPFFLRFASDGQSDREAALHELRERVGKRRSL